MDPPVGEEQVNVPQDSLEERLYLLQFERDRVESRRCQIHVTDVLHKNGILLQSIRAWHIGASLVEYFQGLELISDPRLVAELFTILGPFGHGVQVALLDDGIAVLVQVDAACPVFTIVLQVTQCARPIDLCSNKRRIDRGA